MKPPSLLRWRICAAALSICSAGGVCGQAADPNKAPAVAELPADPFDVLEYRPTGTCFALWRQYVAAKSPKAFAITREQKQLEFYLHPSRYDHYCGFAAAADTPQSAATLAIKYCEDRFVNAECALLAVDDRIIFAPAPK